MHEEEENGTTILRHTAEYAPPPSLRTWLIGRQPATHLSAVPSEAEMVISQITRTAFGERGVLYPARWSS
jgi:hypothetical protein